MASSSAWAYYVVAAVLGSIIGALVTIETFKTEGNKNQDLVLRRL